MTKFKKILFIVVIALLVITGALYIDFFFCKHRETHPRIAIKEKINDDEVVYKAAFYKVWYCKTTKKYTLGGWGDVDAICPSDYEYEDGIYTNGAGLKITEHDLEVIKNYYDNEIIETFNDENQVKDALYVSETYKHLEYKRATDEEGNELSSGRYALVTFPELVLNEENKYEWQQSKAKYCLDNEKYAEYKDEACGEFKPLVYDAEWCKKYTNSIFGYNEEIKAKCKE